MKYKADWNDLVLAYTELPHHNVCIQIELHEIVAAVLSELHLSVRFNDDRVWALESYDD